MNIFITGAQILIESTKLARKDFEQISGETYGLIHRGEHVCTLSNRLQYTKCRWQYLAKDTSGVVKAVSYIIAYRHIFTSDKMSCLRGWNHVKSKE